MRIADVLRNKGAAVVTINPEATVKELLAGLAEQNIGAMVVVGDEGVVGIVSERDVVRQLHTHGASVLSRPVSKIMTATVATCTKADTVDSLSVLMTKNRVRHVPVLDVPEESIRREGAILDREIFDVIAERLRADYAWS
ncbi:CBS domain-containing protein [Mycobacterium sp. E2497]|uniref:CBS domain-containing protein n=1 Tax=Mycobacterium sp. E2497 TaxID=1834135 RepID=UPI0007FD971F|nr:histidine kinase [Mycobacterium sp. E2497]